MSDKYDYFTFRRRDFDQSWDIGINSGRWDEDGEYFTPSPYIKYRCEKQLEEIGFIQQFKNYFKNYYSKNHKSYEIVYPISIILRAGKNRGHKLKSFGIELVFSRFAEQTYYTEEFSTSLYPSSCVEFNKQFNYDGKCKSLKDALEKVKGINFDLLLSKMAKDYYNKSQAKCIYKCVFSDAGVSFTPYVTLFSRNFHVALKEICELGEYVVIEDDGSAIRFEKRGSGTSSGGRAFPCDRWTI
jgi:hypothetical protein